MEMVPRDRGATTPAASEGRRRIDVHADSWAREEVVLEGNQERSKQMPIQPQGMRLAHIYCQTPDSSATTGNPQILQRRGWTYTQDHQKLRRAKNARGDDDFAFSGEYILSAQSVNENAVAILLPSKMIFLAKVDEYTLKSPLLEITGCRNAVSDDSLI
jgi:hypothetical protein